MIDHPATTDELLRLVASRAAEIDAKDAARNYRRRRWWLPFGLFTLGD